ncbi:MULTISPECIES: hypothetical protein [Inquilinus]|uniref:Uncharacterized protein n=1 Tax=Inquilinus ginsengisoli TaxID=363840 RepID=A0ABU1JQ84_9PROT|nr:hypothetical protein [Inquilinus ginsengisoli]MDR6290483.1 hypothetical protein [Inquilinus ginsengisoli]
MKLWKISQDVNDETDTYDSAIVAAETEDAARRIHPNRMPLSWRFSRGTWCLPEEVKVELIGEARAGIRGGVILASFNPE